MPGEPFLTPLVHGDQPHHYRPRQIGPGGFQQWVTRQYRRQATCAEVNCSDWRNGWRTVINDKMPEGRLMADYIRHTAGRAFTVGKTPNGWTEFLFPPGQTCFRSETSAHYIVAEEPLVGLVIPGDHRATTGQARVYDRVDQMVDDFRTHTDQIATARSRAGTAE